MECACIEITTQTTSFRNPDFQNFHKTLDLPPPTTIMGFAGAAMGLSPKMTQDFFDTHSFVVGVYGHFSGKAKDTWKYHKRTENMHLYDPLLDGSVIHREQLIHGNYVFTFGTKNPEVLDQLLKQIQIPFFALTLGSSDSIAHVKGIQRGMTISDSRIISNCLLPGDVIGEVLREASQNLEFSIYQTSEPITYDLPVRFHYQSDYGRREIAQTRTFSFIGQEMQLNYEVPGVKFGKIFIPVFEL